MEHVIEPAPGGPRVPIRIWARAPDPATLRQLTRLAAQPWVVEHVAVMPDAHVAEGVAVGTVFATDRAVVPSALGGDLGCGMVAVRFPFPASSIGRRELERLIEALGSAIPVGDAVHRGRGVPIPDFLFAQELSTHALQRARERLAPRQLGTLGGGNHFLELERDASGDLWLLVHSGSRGLGGAIGAHHARAAAASDQGPLPALDTESPEGRACLADFSWALAFARANRDALRRRAEEIISEATGASPDLASVLDLHHNFVDRQHHGGRPLWIHRKGATWVPGGARGLVPGSMGTASYVVEGLGNAEAFDSCSHGAGRVMSRSEARRAVAPAALERSMRSVVFDRGRTRDLVEEAPAAYRDIREVLEDERDLVRPVLRLEPIAVLKG